MAQTCSVNDCCARVYARGMCRNHYAQVSRYGVLSSERRSRICKTKGCRQFAMLSKDYCVRHHTQIRRGRKAQKEIAYCSVFGCKKLREKSTYCLTHYNAIAADGCLVVSCDESNYARGYCRRHYAQMRENGKILPEPLPKAPVCLIGRCTNSAVAKGYCRKHYDSHYRK